MVKDKTQIVIPPIQIRKSREIPIIIAVIFIGLFIWQCNSTGGLKKDNRELLKTEERLNDIITGNDKRIESDSLIIVTQLNMVDSIMDSFENERVQHKLLKQRYGKIKDDYYNNATIDSKWDLLTRKLDH